MSQHDNEVEECAACGYPLDDCECCPYCDCYPCECDEEEEEEEDVGISLFKPFSQLLDEGFIAKENFSCCQTCAGCEITSLAEEMIDNGTDPKSIKGCVFYHQQDNDNRRRGEDFYLAFGPMDSEKYGEIGLSHENVGTRVVEVLRQHSVKTKWDGSSATRILVCQEEA